MIFRLVASLVLAALTAALWIVPAHAADNPLTGIWKLVSFEARTADGTVTNLYGDKPGGILIYDASGHMSTHAMNLNLEKCGTTDRRSCPDKQARAAFDEYFGYWGRYEVRESEGVVLHILKGASLPDLIGVTLRRFYELSGDRLVLRTPPQKVRGVEMVITVTVERVRREE